MKMSYLKEFIRVYALIEEKKIVYFISIFITCIAYPSLNIIFSFAYKLSINAIEFNHFSLFINTCILFLVAAIIQCLVEPFANYINARAVNDIVCRIKNKVFRHALSLPVSYFEKNRNADTVLRLTLNIDSFEPILRAGIRDVMQTLFLGIGALISMLILSYQLTLAALAFSVLAYLANFAFAKEIRKCSDIQYKCNAGLSQALAVTYETGQTAKAFNREDFLLAKFNESNKNAVSAAFRLAIRGMFKDGLTSLVTNVSRLVILICGLVMVINKQLDIGSVVGIISLQFGLTNMFVSLGGFLTNMQNNLAGANRVFALLDSQTEKSKYSKAIPGNITRNDVITYENVCYSYDNRVPVFDRLSFNIEENRMIAIIGPNGSGKSTLIKLLLGYYEPEGNIAYYQQAMGDYDLSEIRGKISYVSQRAVLLNGSILENIKYGDRDATMEQVIRAAKKANIHDYVMSLKEGYDSFVGEEGIYLSGGQKQRINIARALLKDAPIILFDEATSSIDNEDELDILQTLKKIKGQYTIIIITHRLQSIQDADWIIVLENGKIAGQGAYGHLQKKDCETMLI